MEVTLTADFFTQMRSTMNLRRALVNQMILEYANEMVNILCNTGPPGGSRWYLLPLI